MLDLIIRNANLPNGQKGIDIAIKNGSMPRRLGGSMLPTGWQHRLLLTATFIWIQRCPTASPA